MEMLVLRETGQNAIFDHWQAFFLLKNVVKQATRLLLSPQYQLKLFFCSRSRADEDSHEELLK